MQVLETVKQHPLYVVGALGIVFVLYVYLNSGSGVASGTGSASDIYAAQNAAGDQLQALSISAQLQQAAIGADLTKTQIGAQSSLDIAQLSKDVALTQINQQGESLDLSNVLTANVAMANIKAGTDQAQISSNTTIATTQAVAGALVEQSALSAGVASQAIAAQKKQCGFVGKIFGC